MVIFEIEKPKPWTYRKFSCLLFEVRRRLAGIKLWTFAAVAPLGPLPLPLVIKHHDSRFISTHRDFEGVRAKSSLRFR